MLCEVKQHSMGFAYFFIPQLNSTHTYTHLHICIYAHDEFCLNNKKKGRSTMKWYQPFKMSYRWALNPTFNRRHIEWWWKRSKIVREWERDVPGKKIQNERNEYGPIEFIYAQDGRSRIRINTLGVSARTMRIAHGTVCKLSQKMCVQPTARYSVQRTKHTQTQYLFIMYDYRSTGITFYSLKSIFLFLLLFLFCFLHVQKKSQPRKYTENWHMCVWVCFVYNKVKCYINHNTNEEWMWIQEVREEP